MIRPRDLVEALNAVDADVRAASPKCPECERPDGGVVPTGSSCWAAGLVDRKRCPSPTCPMRDRKGFDSRVVNRGAPA